MKTEKPWFLVLVNLNTTSYKLAAARGNGGGQQVEVLERLSEDAFTNTRKSD